MRTKVLAWVVSILALAFLVGLTVKTYYDAINLVEEAKSLSIENLTKLLKSALLILLFIVLVFYTMIVVLIITLRDKLFSFFE